MCNDEPIPARTYIQKATHVKMSSILWRSGIIMKQNIIILPGGGLALDEQSKRTRTRLLLIILILITIPCYILGLVLLRLNRDSRPVAPTQTSTVFIPYIDPNTPTITLTEYLTRTATTTPTETPTLLPTESPTPSKTASPTLTETPTETAASPDLPTDVPEPSETPAPSAEPINPIPTEP